MIKNYNEVNIQIQLRNSLRLYTDLIEVINCQIEALPEYLPTKWDLHEPIKRPFPQHNLSEALYNMIPDQETFPGVFSAPGGHYLLWKRIGTDRADGMWCARWDFNYKFNSLPNHAINLISVYSTKYQKSLINFLQFFCLKFPINLCVIDAKTINYNTYEHGWDGPDILLTTHLLRNWLPDITWCAVFGPDYINHFGKERLLSSPAYITQALNEEAIFIQLTPDLNDLYNDFEAVMAVREKVKHHLGYESFYQKELAYDWHTPSSTNPNAHPEYAGKVFRVPEFHFIDDGFPPSWIINEKMADIYFQNQKRIRKACFKESRT